MLQTSLPVHQLQYELNVDTKLLGNRLTKKIAELNGLCKANEEIWKDEVAKPLFKELLPEFFSYPYAFLAFFLRWLLFSSP